MGFSGAQGSNSLSSSSLDTTFGSTRGAILERGASGWTLISPGTSGHVLTSNGSGADPSYAVVTNYWSRSGTVISPATAGDTLNIGSGTITAPSYSFSDETGLGQYRQGAGTIDVASGNTAGAHFRIHPTLTSPTAASTIQVYSKDNGSGTPMGGVVVYSLPSGYTSSAFFRASSGVIVADANLSTGLVVGTSGGAGVPLYFGTDSVAYEKRSGTSITMSSDTAMGWCNVAGGTGLFGATSNDAQFKRDEAGVIGVYAAGSNYGKLAFAAARTISAGTGSPEAAVTASIGSLFLRTDGAAGTTLYTKTSGNGLNTGWSAVGALSGITNSVAGKLVWNTGSGAVTHLTGPTDNEFLFQCGAANTVTSAGNNFTLRAGDGGSTSGAGGVLGLNGGHAAGGNSAGGDVSIQPGSAFGSGNGGKTTISGGSADTTGTGGNVEIQAGPGGQTSGNGGDVIIQGGPVATAGAGGNLWLDGGEAVGINRAGGWVRLRAGQNTGTGAEGYISFEVERTGVGGTEVARIIKQGALVMTERTTDPTTTNLAANGAVAIYNKNNKLVFAFNNAGTMTYVTIALDGTTTTWAQSTVAP